MSNIYEQHQPKTGGVFLKFEDGVQVKLRIISDPYIYTQTYENKKDGTFDTSTKYAWVVYNYEEDTAQVLQLPPTGYREIAKYAVDEEYGDPTKYDLKITRFMEDTGFRKYKIMASPTKSDLPDDKKDMAKEVSVEKLISNAIPLSELDKKPAKKEDVVIDEISDEPVDLSEIPF